MRIPRLVVAAVAAVPLIVLSAPVAVAAPATAATTTPAASGPSDQKIVVVLRDQHTDKPATRSQASSRASADAASQAPLLKEVSASGGTAIKTLQTIDAFSATVSLAEKAKLAANPAVSTVVDDALVSLAPPTTSAANAAAAAGGSTSAPAGTCSSTTPQLNPEALTTIHANTQDPSAKSARQLGYTGKGVTVAYMAEGIDINNPDFIRADGSHVFSDYQDFTGDGLDAPTAGGEAFLDAGSIAAQGRITYDVAGYGQNAVTTPCKIRIEGVSPGVSLVGLKVFAENNFTTESNFLQAIDYAVFTDHVDILNESFGSDPFPDTFNDVTRIFDEQAVAAGTTVVVSSGDAGITSTIGSPASDPDVISVGASTTYRINLQTGYAGARLPGVSGYLSNNISSISSAGTTEAGRTVDLVAPGELNWTLCTPDLSMYFDCANYLGQPSATMASGGTSESAPLTAGAAALVIEAYRGAHNGASPTPAQIKQILVSTSDDVYAPADQQGAGLLDTYRAVQAATAAPAAALLIGTSDSAGSDQLDVSANPGTSVSPSFTVTNTGAASQTVKVTPRRLGDYTDIVSTSVTLSDSTSAKAPDYSGTRTDNVEKVTFTVPSGQARLQANIAYQEATGSSSDASGRVRITLVDPKGRLASYSLPQGAGNYGDSEVSTPTPGTWTAYVYSRTTASGGTVGPVQFRARTANYVAVGTVSPASMSLAAGQVGTFTYTTTTPAAPGDSATSLVVQGSVPTPGITTVPVILRSVLPVTKAAQSFTQTLTGGNGRATFTGQTFYYKLAVPSGLAALNTAVSLSSAPNSTFSVELVDAAGNTLATGGNTITQTQPDGSTTAQNQKSGVAHVLAPAAGTYDLIVNFYNQVQGDQLSTPFTVEVDATPTPLTSSLPSGTVPAGSTVNGFVQVTNNTPATEEYFVDARLANLVRLPVAVSSATTALPADGEPQWIVPSNSTSITVAASGSLPLTFDTGFDFGDPDLTAQSQGKTATVTYNGNPITPGPWFALPSEIGPYGAGPAPTGTQTTTVSVTTRAFDTSATSSTGDLWKQSYDPSSPLTPVIVAPGATVSIPVTFAVPAGAAVGSVVTGTLFLDDYTLVNSSFVGPNGAQVASVPYSYKVGAATK